jgi:hypothetical protein
MAFMPKCACGEKPQDGNIKVKGKKINMVFLHIPFLTARLKTPKQK